ncbi:MAG: hypothetical protein Q9190_007505, partial [Brigantiaea leucoxantha]
MDSPHFEADIFADGVLRNFWQSSRNKVNTRRSPDIEFTQGIHKFCRSTYRSQMVTALVPDIRNATPSSLEERDKVGTIEIVINKADEFKYTHPHGALLPDGLPKDWAESPAKPVKGQIHPTLHITFVDHLVPLRTLTTYRFPEAGKRMSEADRCGTRERMRRLRQGPEPWVSFKFIYREREYLRSAGIMTSGSLVQYDDAVRSLPNGRKRKVRESEDEDDLEEVQASRGKDALRRLRAEILELAIQKDMVEKKAREKKQRKEEQEATIRNEWAELQMQKTLLEKGIQEARDGARKDE